MIRFLDIESKRTFDASQPYVFYVGTGCSTGKWYSKNIVALSDDQELVCSVPSDSYFHLVDLSRNTEPVNVANHEYINLEDIIVESVQSTGEEVSDGIYCHKFYIVFMSDTEGEFHDTFTLSHQLNGETLADEYEIAADVYMEDERLSIDLANEGIEIPDAFQRAVYPTNVRDESSDKILLNRKWKELLIEYWNVAANKGSYNSLVNSLKFFEYGDLVHIEEYWKQTDSFGIEEMIGRDIEQVLDPLIRQYLDVMSKTTYIGLYLTIDEMKRKQTGEVEYAEQLNGDHLDKFIAEPIPVLQQTALRYTVDDLAMKMTLLANYFSTYFMPIHLDLIHSSIDKLVFTNTLKILRGIRSRREDWYDSLSPISCNLSIDKDYWIGNVRAFNYPDTAMRNDGIPVYWGDLPMVGMDTTIEDKAMTQQETEQFLNQYFGGVGCFVPIHLAFSDVRDFIKTTRISIYRKVEDENYVLENTYLWEKPFSDDTLDFNLVFAHSGQHCVMVQATRVDGTDFAGSWYINVHGHIGNLITIKRFRKIDYREDQQLFDDWFYDNLDFNDFMFTEPFDKQTTYKQWLTPTNGFDVEGVGLNHIVVVDCGSSAGERPIAFNCNGIEKTFQFSDTIADRLSNEYPHYWWKKMTRTVATRFNGELALTGTDRYYIVGVRKWFDTEEDSRDLYSGYYKKYSNGELEDVEVVNVRYQSSTSPRFRGMLVVTCPVGSTLQLDNGSPFTTTEETNTIPVRKDRSVLHIRYTCENHLFTKDVEVPDMFSMYGREEYKVHPTDASRKKGYATIDTSRFFPIFHKLEEIEGFTVSRDETVVCLPNFRWIDKQVEDCYWEFINRTTGETISSKSFKSTGDELYIQEPFVGKFDYVGTLRKGYYDVVLHFSMGGTEQTETVESAFRIA